MKIKLKCSKMRFWLQTWPKKINCNLGTDPNISYAILEETITKAKDKYFPEKNRHV